MPSAAHTSPLQSERAVSLVEVLVVLVILGVLSALLFPSMRGWQEGARRDGGVSAAREYATAIEMFARDHAGRPPAMTSSDWPATARTKGPVDTSTGKNYLSITPEPVQDGVVDFLPSTTSGTPIALEYDIVVGTPGSPDLWSLQVSEHQRSGSDRVVCWFGTAPRPTGVEEC